MRDSSPEPSDDSAVGLTRGAREGIGRLLTLAGMVVALGVAPAVFLPGIYDDFTLMKQSALLVAAALLLVGFAAAPEVLPRRPVVRYAFLALVAWTTLAWLLGEDPRGGTLGVYQYRHGYLTDVSYFALFLGGIATVRMGRTKLAVVAVAAGLAAAVLYTAVQAVGRDPVDWWTNTATRAIGTIGNANELASYALIALAFLGLAAPGGGRLRMAVLVCSAAAVSFVILESESRSGLAALGVAVACVPVAAELARGGRREAWRETALLVAGFTAGFVLSVAAGSFVDGNPNAGRAGTGPDESGALGTIDRVRSGVTHGDEGASTRYALWRGTVPAIMASPLWGSGPDGLFLSFPQHRPADLGGEFEQYDLTVQSSHNLVLDTAAATGLVGLGASVVLTLAVLAGSLRQRERLMAGSYVAWGGIAGYLAMTMLNPLSLAGHAGFCALLGVMEGQTQVRTLTRGTTWPAWPKWTVVAPVAAALTVIAVLQPFADRRAEKAWGAYAAKDYRTAAGRYEDAAALMPLSRDYSQRAALSWLRSLDLEEAERALTQFDERFGAGSNEVLDLAAVRIALGYPAEETLPLIDRGEGLNPHGLAVAASAAQFRVGAVAESVVFGISDTDVRPGISPR
ncbi:MAG: O-antigen ligase family protein [Chloroflexi bacterium]|nr:O-antigen ligase family protein [Chloroflexota bacterium]